jgi:hypothetical protein
MKLWMTLPVSAVCLLFAPAARAQWGLSQFDTNKTVTLDGYLSKVDLDGREPGGCAVAINLNVKDGAGKTVVWSIAVLEPSGAMCNFARESLRVGKRLQVTGNPIRVSATSQAKTRMESPLEAERRQAGRVLYGKTFTVEGRRFP